jgi:hypothetical protein
MSAGRLRALGGSGHFIFILVPIRTPSDRIDATMIRMGNGELNSDSWATAAVLSTAPLSAICSGDVLGPVPITWVKEDGEVGTDFTIGGKLG